MVVEKTMHVADRVAVQITSNHLASIIDAQGIGIESPRKIDRCVSAMVVKKAVIDAATVVVNSNNLSSVVDAFRRDTVAARGINRFVGALVVEKTYYG